MKEKILAAIRAKFPKVNLSKKRLEAIAAKIEAKVIDDETKIDAELDTYNDYFPLEEMAKADDKIRNLEAKAKALKTPPKDESVEEPVEPVPDDAPAWAKALIEQNKTLAAGLAAIQGKETRTTIQQKIAEKLGKDVPGTFWTKRGLPEKDEDVEAFITDVTTDYTALRAEMGIPEGTTITRPMVGISGNQGKAGVDPALKAFVENRAKLPVPENNMIIKSTQKV